MTHCSRFVPGRAAVLALAALLLAGRLPATEPARPGDHEDAVKALAGRIDHHIEAGWKQHGVKPAQPADDATFLRRVWLDLAGKAPSLTAARDFLDDPSPSKRRQLVRRLLSSDDYARHTATLWGRQLFPPGPDAIPALTPDSPGKIWLRRQIQDGVGHDRIVRSLLTPPQGGDAAANAAQEFLGTNQGRADTLAAAASRLFLGVRLECAQCHNHPFAAWQRDQFWSFAAFFSVLPGPDQQRPRPREPGREIAIPNTDKVVRARFLDGIRPQFKDGDDGREVLAAWIVRPENPYFARAAVNRIWDRYFGTGIVDPPDNMIPENPPSHPELLDELTRSFSAGGFDERSLTEAILASKAYQLSSTATDPSPANPRQFARAAVRGLTAEQVFDSLAEATGVFTPRNGRTVVPDINTPRGQFLARFTTPNRPTEAQTPALQALHLMNGPLVAEATQPERNRWLRVLTESAAERPERCVEELYLTVLTRLPQQTERERFVQYIRSGGPHKDPRRAVADIFWVLLNSPEFVLNH